MSSSSPKLILCPYCGHTQTAPERCERCSGLFEGLSRKATQIKMGPWFIRDKSNPFRPGCSYEVLKKQISLGKIKPTTIMRGPSTYQFWSVARNVPGVAHLLGYCHRCGAHCDPQCVACPDCSEPFLPVEERNELGLMYRTPGALSMAQLSLEDDILKKRAESDGATTPDDSADVEQNQQAPAGAVLDGRNMDLSDTSLGLHFDIDEDSTGLSDSHTDLLITPQNHEVIDSTRDRPLSSVTTPAQAPPTHEAAAGPSPANDSPPTDNNPQPQVVIVPSTPVSTKASSVRPMLMLWLLLATNLVTLAINWELWAPKILNQRQASLVADASPQPIAQDQPVASQVAVHSTGQDAGHLNTPPQVPTNPAPQTDPSATPQTTVDPHSNSTLTTPPIPTIAQASHQQLANQLAEADQLIKMGKTKEALAILESISQSVPKEQHPEGLDRAIGQLEQQIAHVEAASFFGIPMK